MGATSSRAGGRASGVIDRNRGAGPGRQLTFVGPGKRIALLDFHAEVTRFP
jgi:hypothetical protein